MVIFSFLESSVPLFGTMDASGKQGRSTESEARPALGGRFSRADLL